MEIKTLLKKTQPLAEAIGWASLHFITLIICTYVIAFVFGYLPCSAWVDDCLLKQFGVFIFLYFTSMIAVFYKEK